MTAQHRTYISEIRAQGREEGRREAVAEILLMVLAEWGIGISDAQRELIDGCVSVDQLETWIVRASSASSADEVFA
ncbi:hypothetical protein LO762_30055 [Actinocorallia sp. API 0066]|uniref:hypothetical protein n=1 Tax=Actinocorallia sp. API 0066 TaxID=2896846 RepID=UPI001E3C10A7|nr:hypothetical protein [Actinocorallia sp. API 0066]MCD0453393.1 hypothetical protein [Actinocorallia sp. API 0066]